MLQIQKDTSFSERGLLFGIVEVIFPQPSEWDETGFAALKERELAALFNEFRDYDRKAVFGENTYYRYFKKCNCSAGGKNLTRQNVENENTDAARCRAGQGHRGIVLS